MTHRKYNYWLGIRGIRYINHGEWSDPEIRYKNIVINYYDLEDYVCNAMREENKCPDNETDFENWCKENARAIKGYILDIAQFVVQ